MTTLQRITGKPSGAARSLLGKLLKSSEDDCAAVLAALRECPESGDPIAWLMAAVSARGKQPFRNGVFDLIRAGGIGSDEPSDYENQLMLLEE